MNQLNQLYYTHQQASERDRLFLEMAKDMTRKELEALIAKRPELWGRYRAFLDKLP